MDYKNTLKDYLTQEEIKKTKRNYKLSYKIQKSKSGKHSFIKNFFETDSILIKSNKRLKKDIILKKEGCIKNLLKNTLLIKNYLERYEYTDNPREMSVDKISEYLRVNYVNNSTINKNKLINDLVVFKSYKSYLEIEVDNDKAFWEFIFKYYTMTFAIVTIFLAFLAVSPERIQGTGLELWLEYKLEQIKDDFNIVNYISILILFYLTSVPIGHLVTTDRKSDSNRLKTVNNVINTLEALKESLF